MYRYTYPLYICADYAILFIALKMVLGYTETFAIVTYANKESF